MRSVKEIDDAIMSTKSTIAFCDEKLATKVTHLNPKLVKDLVEKKEMSYTIISCLEWALGNYPLLPAPAF